MRAKVVQKNTRSFRNGPKEACASLEEKKDVCVYQITLQDSCQLRRLAIIEAKKLPPACRNGKPTVRDVSDADSLLFTRVSSVFRVLSFRATDRARVVVSERNHPPGPMLRLVL